MVVIAKTPIAPGSNLVQLASLFKNPFFCISACEAKKERKPRSVLIACGFRYPERKEKTV